MPLKLKPLFASFALLGLAACDEEAARRHAFMCDRTETEFISAYATQTVQTGTRTELDASYIAIFGFPLPVSKPVYATVPRDRAELIDLLSRRVAVCAKNQP